MDKNTLFSSFGKWLAPICSKTFTDCVKEQNQDKYTKKLTTLAYFKLFLHAELQGRDGLRDIANDVLCPAFQQELGLSSISSSQLCRKNNQVNPALLEQVYYQLVKRIHSKANPERLRTKFKIIDSTTIVLCLQKFKWAHFRSSKSGIKLHSRITYWDDEEVYPDKVKVTPANVNDRVPLEELADEKGITYVFDRGYVDYAAYDRFCKEQIFFVTRLKNNAMIEPLESYELPAKNTVSLDEKIRVGTQKNRMEYPLRMIQTVDSEGNLLFLLTNRFDLKADEISEMYRNRWAIETFFKWMKQHIKIKTFYGTSENAVMNQVWMALIAYCLLALVKQDLKREHSLLEISRRLKVFLWRSCIEWIEQLNRAPSKTSAGRKRTIIP